MNERNRAPRFAALLLSAGIVALVAAPAGADIEIDLGRGPVTVFTPAGYDPSRPAPLLLALHGYTSSGSEIESYVRFRAIQDEFGFLYAHPNGTRDGWDLRFWNATDACCDFDGSGVDDSGYLRDLIDAIETELRVDPRRVYLAGHSNGGFMSYRLGCDLSERIAALVSLAGATWYDPADCAPTSPVHILQIHGTDDAVVDYDGGFALALYPGAEETTEQWAMFGACFPEPDETLPPLDIDRVIPGDETLVSQYEMDCMPGGSAELWSIVGGSHTPALVTHFNRLVIDFLYSHPKPNPCPGDIDGDLEVGLTDLSILLGNFGLAGTFYEQDGDLNGDRTVDLSDLSILLGAFGASCT